MITQPPVQKFIGPVLLSAYAAVSVSAWLFGDIFQLLAWIMSAMVGMYLVMRLITLTKISPWDSFWRPAIGVTWFWVSAALVFLCTSELLQYVTWQAALLGCICLILLVFAWWLRAKEKRLIAHAFLWLHLLGTLGVTLILDHIHGL